MIIEIKKNYYYPCTLRGPRILGQIMAGNSPLKKCQQIKMEQEAHVLRGRKTHREVHISITTEDAKVKINVYDAPDYISGCVNDSYNHPYFYFDISCYAADVNIKHVREIIPFFEKMRNEACKILPHQNNKNVTGRVYYTPISESFDDSKIKDERTIKIDNCIMPLIGAINVSVSNLSHDVLCELAEKYGIIIAESKLFKTDNFSYYDLFCNYNSNYINKRSKTMIYDDNYRHCFRFSHKTEKSSWFVPLKDDEIVSQYNIERLMENYRHRILSPDPTQPEG